MLTTFGTTFLSNLFNGVYGIAQGIANATDDDENTKFIHGLWSNDLINGMQSVNEWAEKAMPNYYTQYEQSLPWHSKLGTANFWGDHFIKNLGFQLGTAASMLTFGQLGSIFGITGKLAEAGKAGKFAAWILNDAMSSHGESSIEAANAISEERKLLDNNKKKFIEQK